MKVFWSWQSDTPAKLNKEFVKTALNDALTQVSAILQLSEAERPEVDHDTKGEAGLVEIVTTIFRKIEEAEVFVADVTFVGKTAAGKWLPNPNVMIELGHALSSRGAERIILVANAAFDFKLEDLPFDLRHRRGPITYTLAEGATKEERNAARTQLTKALTEALRLNLAAALKARATATPFKLHPAQPNDRSTWLAPGEPIRHQDSFSGGDREWVLPAGPRYYMRLAPAVSPTALSRADVLQRSQHLWALGPWQSGDFGLNTDGVVKVGIHPRLPVTAIGVAQWFKNTGEVWGFNGAVSMERDGKRYVSVDSIAREWGTFLRSSLDFLEQLGAQGPLRIEAGAVGLDGLYWTDEMWGAAKALDSEFYLERTHRSWGAVEQNDFLVDLYNLLHEAFGKHHAPAERVPGLA